VRIGDGEARLLPPASLTGHWIPLAPAGSANEEIMFGSDGDVAAVGLGDHALSDCVGTRDRAALAEAVGGLSFQAFGDDPAWTLEITQQDFTVIDRTRCYDAGSGETDEHTVALTFDNAWYYGCGRFICYR
jgi:hypothetical protein